MTTRVSITVALDEAWSVCYRYADRSPLLSIITPSAGLTLVDDSTDPAARERIADELLRAVTEYARANEAWCRSQGRSTPNGEQAS